MFKKLGFTLNSFPNYLFRNFTFKYVKGNVSSGPLNSRLNASEVNSKIKNIILNYQEKRQMVELEQIYFTENLKFFKIEKKADLPIISEMLAISYQNLVNNVEIRNKKNSSYKIKDLQEPENTRGEIPKSTYDIFESFRKILNKKLKSKELTLDDFFDLNKSLSKVKNLNPKFLFILSDSLEVLINDIIQNKTKKYNLKYLEKNLENFKKLSEIPLGKKLIGSLTNMILKNEIEGNENIKISDELSEFLPSTFFGYDSDIFLNFIVLNPKIKITEDNEQNYFSTFLYSVKELFGKSESKEKINKLNQQHFSILDSRLSELIEKLYSKNKYRIEKINVLFKQFLTLEKLNLAEMKMFPKFIKSSNEILKDYYGNHNSNFRDYFFTIRFMINFYAKFYVELKHYLFTEDNELNTIFHDYHSILLKTFSMMKEHKINWKENSEQNSDFIFNVINLLYTNATNHIKNKDCENFILNNFNKETVDQISEKTIPTQSIQRTLHKIILLYTNVDSPQKADFLDYSIGKFLNLYEDKKTNLKEMNNYFLNLNTTLYNLLLDNYQNEELLCKMIEKIFKIMKMFDFKEEKHIHRLIIIIENLKLLNVKIYEKFSAQFSKLEGIHKNLPEGAKTKLWWDKKVYSINKYELVQLENFLKEHGEVSVAPWFKNMYSCDFLLKTNSGETYLDFISPYHIINFEDYNDNLSLNSKYLRKAQIFKGNEKPFVYIPYEETLSDLNNITKYLK